MSRIGDLHRSLTVAVLEQVFRRESLRRLALGSEGGRSARVFKGEDVGNLRIPCLRANAQRTVLVGLVRGQLDPTASHAARRCRRSRRVQFQSPSPAPRGPTGNPSHLGPRPPWVGERLDRRYKEHLLCSQIALIEPIGLFPLRDPQHRARRNGVGQVDSRVGKQHLNFAVGSALKDIKVRRTGGSKREIQAGVGGKGGSRCNSVSPVVAWLFGMHCKVEAPWTPTPATVKPAVAFRPS